MAVNEKYPKNYQGREEKEDEKGTKDIAEHNKGEMKVNKKISGP